MQNITTYKLWILNTLEISFENLMREWRTLIAGLTRNHSIRKRLLAFTLRFYRHAPLEMYVSMYVNVQQMYVCKTNPEALQEKKVYLHRIWSTIFHKYNSRPYLSINICTREYLSILYIFTMPVHRHRLTHYTQLSKIL